MRVMVVLAALVACAWFIVGIRQVNGTEAATTIVSHPAKLTAQRVADAKSAIDEAATLNPDAGVRILRARLALVRGDTTGAQAILDGVVRDEPKNINAWYWLAAASSHDPNTFLRTVRAIRRLQPPVPAH